MQLGKIITVDLREVWPNEASSFTPWLAANPHELGEILGLDLEFSTEAAIGKFSLDLLGRDLNTGMKVIVENQLEQSDHGHLGQLLTYAGGSNPSVIVWIAKSIRSEHRAALEWLNNATNSETQFFGIEVKAIRIGDSNPAPMLDIVVQPNSWSKSMRSSSPGAFDSEKSRSYAAFWATFIDSVSEQLPEFKNRTAWARNWLPSGVGMSGVNLNLVFYSDGLRAEYYLGLADEASNTQRFGLLSDIRELIESGLGKKLEWEGLDGKKASRIALYGLKGDISDTERWPEYIEWFAQSFAEMKTVANKEILPAIKAAEINS